MLHEDFSDAALVLVGHGSTKNAESDGPVFQHATELRRRGIFAEVREAFWKQEPAVVEVLKQVSRVRTFIVPVFISEGYFSEAVIPEALGFHLTEDAGLRITHHASTLQFYCRPVGTHESMTSVVLARAREVVKRNPFPRAPGVEETTLFIAGHGTQQNEKSREAAELQAERIRALHEYAGVHAVFLEESPRIPDCYSLAQTRNIVVVPFFISDGLHTREDIPVLLGEPERLVRQRLQKGLPPWHNPTERHGRLVWYASAVGTEPLIADVIMDRVREAARWQPSYA